MTDKDKREYIILISLIAILTCIWIYTKTSNNKIHYKLPTIPSINKQKIDKIIIQKKNFKLIMKKIKNNNWIIEKKHYVVDKTKINNMLDDMHNLKLTTLVSTKRDYARYWLDKDAGINISMYANGNKKIEIVLGKLGPNYNTSYIRLDDNPDIYLARGNLRLSFDVDVDEMRDKRLLSFNEREISSIIFQYKELQYIFKKQNIEGKIQWEFNNKNINLNKIKSILKELKSIQCETYNVDKSKIKNKKEFMTIILKDSSSHKIQIFKCKYDNNNSYIGVSTDRKGIFIISQYDVNNLIKNIKKIIPTESKNLHHKRQKNRKDRSKK